MSFKIETANSGHLESIRHWLETEEDDASGFLSNFKSLAADDPSLTRLTVALEQEAGDVLGFFAGASDGYARELYIMAVRPQYRRGLPEIVWVRCEFCPASPPALAGAAFAG